ncbi:hypothetical protein [Dyella sp. C11]|uniref:hypothetical protein n=1 Tax=Dyella sp. C11 TaxID=2126991 RepID=UPI000D641B78|nr:hypothetical protein [Dyella sp. C11]
MRAGKFSAVVLIVSLMGSGEALHAAPSVQLFGEDGAPRFNAYLACTSRTVNCSIIEHMFDRWADSRDVSLHEVGPDDAAFSNGTPSQAPEQKLPYRVSVRYAPEMASLSNSLQGGATGLPVVSYVANVRVFDASSGKLLKSMSMHDEKMVDQAQGAANPYLEAHVRAFLKRLDPAYTPAPAP